MYRSRFDAGHCYIYIALLLMNVCQVTHSLSSTAGEDVLLVGPNQRAHAKTSCKCTLVAGKLTDEFDSDDIAVSFTVDVKSSRNSTSGENRLFILVRNIRAMFLLALPDDSEILSLLTLQHSVQTSSISMYPVNDSDCFSPLNPMCQYAVIVAAFYNDREFQVKQGEPICFPPLSPKNSSEDHNIVHRCCSWKESLNFGYVNCSQVITPNKWVAYAIHAVQIGSALLFLLAPLLFKYLPTRDTQIVRRSRVTGPKRLGYSNYLATPVDSSISNRKLLTLLEPLTFATCGGDEAMACYSRLCRVTALFIFPSIFCVFVLVFFLINKNTKTRTNVTYYTGLVGFLETPVQYYVFGIVVFSILLLGILVLIPGRLSGVGKALSGRKDERTFLGFAKPEQYINQRSGNSGFQFMQSNMVFHIKCCFELGFWFFILKIIVAPCTYLLQSCCCPAQDSSAEQLTDPDEDGEAPKFCLVVGLIFLPVIMALWVPFVLFSFVVYITPTGYVAFRIFRLLYGHDIPLRSECCERLPFCIRLFVVLFLYCMFILFCTCVLGSYIFLMLMFDVFFYMLGKIFLYSLIGLSFNIEFYLSWTVAGFFVIFYFWRAFYHYFSVYENLRIVLFEECEKYEQQESMNVQQTSSPIESSSLSSQTARPGLLLLDNNNTPAVPLNLYIAVYRRLRPRGKTFFTILMKLLLTLVYLSIAFAAIMSLDEAEDTSTYVQAVFLCVTFALPLVLFHGSSSRSRRRRKDLEYQVRFIIHRYVLKLGNVQEASVVDNPSVADATGNVEFLPKNNDMFEI